MGDFYLFTFIYFHNLFQSFRACQGILFFFSFKSGKDSSQAQNDRGNKTDFDLIRNDREDNLKPPRVRGFYV